MENNYMANKLDEKEIIDFLDRFEHNQIDKQSQLSFIMKLVNAYLMLDKRLNEEIHQLRKSVSSKHLEVSTLLLNSIEKQEFMNFISNGLNELKKLDDGKNYKYISRLENQILNYSFFTEDSWDYLFKHFLIQQKIDLKKSLNQYNLSESEFKVCALIHLNFSAKDMAKILNLSPKSIESQKYRIKRKLGLPKEQSILEYINKIFEETTNA